MSPADTGAAGRSQRLADGGAEGRPGRGLQADAATRLGVGYGPFRVLKPTVAPTRAGANFCRSLGGVARSERIDVRMTPAEVARVDELRGPRSRPAFVRALLAAAGPLDAQDQPSHREAVRVLRERALAGNTTAAVAYERALRATPRSPEALVGDELETLIRGDG
jgi:hypothetical protein